VLSDPQGNVVGLATAGGTLVAEYDYDPYGRLIRETGPKAATCPFRYSTKYRDPDLDLYYYGHRWYDAAAMKWLTPDPIGERGGANLTASCDGDPINNVDPLGLDPEFRAGLGLTLSLESGMRLVRKLTAVLSAQTQLDDDWRATADITAQLYRGGIGTLNVRAHWAYDLSAFLRFTRGRGEGRELPVTLIGRDVESAFGDRFASSETIGGGINYNSATRGWTTHHTLGIRRPGWSFDYQNDMGTLPFIPAVPFVDFFNVGTDQARTGKGILQLKLGEDAILQFGYEQFTGVPTSPSAGKRTVYEQRHNDYDLNRADTFIGFGERKSGAMVRQGFSGPHWLQNAIHWCRDISHFERTDPGRVFWECGWRLKQ